MKVLICGDRDWDDYLKIYNRMRNIPTGSLIITGGARGADTIAYKLAQKLGFKKICIKADWKRYGLAAGPIRNRQMLDLEPELVIAFHPNIEQSLGTKNCREQAEDRGIPVEVIT
jgi:hypothetical protein